MSKDHLLLWDFDNTLAWREGLWSGALHTALLRVGAGEVDIGLVREALSRGFPWHDPDAGHEHIADSESWWSELTPVLVTAARRAGASASLASRAAELVRVIYLDPTTWSVFPDASTALNRASSRGWRNAILSNHVPELAELVGQLGLADHFEAVITSARLGWEKPNRRAFELAVQHLGSPRTVVMIGDSRRADYDGAIGAGISAVLIERGADCDASLVRAVSMLPDAGLATSDRAAPN